MRSSMPSDALLAACSTRKTGIGLARRGPLRSGWRRSRFGGAVARRLGRGLQPQDVTHQIARGLTNCRRIHERHQRAHDLARGIEIRQTRQDLRVYEGVVFPARRHQPRALDGPQGFLRGSRLRKKLNHRETREGIRHLGSMPADNLDQPARRLDLFRARRLAATLDHRRNPHRGRVRGEPVGGIAGRAAARLALSWSAAGDGEQSPDQLHPHIVRIELRRRATAGPPPRRSAAAESGTRPGTPPRPPPGGAWPRHRTAPLVRELVLDRLERAAAGRSRGARVHAAAPNACCHACVGAIPSATRWRYAVSSAVRAVVPAGSGG